MFSTRLAFSKLHFPALAAIVLTTYLPIFIRASRNFLLIFPGDTTGEKEKPLRHPVNDSSSQALFILLCFRLALSRSGILTIQKTCRANVRCIPNNNIIYRMYADRTGQYLYNTEESK